MSSIGILFQINGDFTATLSLTTNQDTGETRKVSVNGRLNEDITSAVLENVDLSQDVPFVVDLRFHSEVQAPTNRISVLFENKKRKLELEIYMFL